MAHHLSTAAFFLLILTTLITAAASDSNSLQEVDTMMEALRTHGYNLFSNAITTSDLQYQLLSSPTTTTTTAFTIFAPRDSHLYSLDMDSDASAYVSTLRYHVSPNRRLTLSDLRDLSSPFLDTLLPHYSILVSSNKASRLRNGSVLNHNSNKMDMVRVDGVSISDPDLYVGSRFIVHGLDGILVTGLVKNEDLSDDGFISAPAAAPVPEVEEAAEVVQVLAPPVDLSIEVAPPIRPPVAAETGKRLKMKKRGKHHHHRRNRSHRRQSRIADHRKDDL